MAEPLYEHDDPMAATVDTRTGPLIQRTTTAEWVLAARILAGAPLVYYGFNHAMDPALVRNMLIASQVPTVSLLTFLLPPLELIVGVMMLAGAYARVAAGGGMALALTLTWLTWTCLTLKEGFLPPGMTEPPPTPSLPLPPVVFIANVIIAIMGAGPLSVDEHMTRPEAPPPPDPDAPPTGII